MTRNFYEVLGVGTDASREEIKKAYVALAKRYHPDVTELPKEQAEKLMAAVNEAYAVLSDLQQRQAYDNGAAGGVYANVDNSAAYALANEVLQRQCQRARRQAQTVAGEALQELWREFGEDTYYTYHRLQDVGCLWPETRASYTAALQSFANAFGAAGAYQRAQEVAKLWAQKCE